MAHLPRRIFLGKTIHIIFLNLLALFIKQNFIKIIQADQELWQHAIFGPRIVQEMIQ